MTGTTLGGWPGIETAQEQRDHLVWIKVPGTVKKVQLRKEVAPVFAAFLAEVHKKVIDLNKGPLDGWEFRQARTGAGLSQHAGAVASDMRYDVLLADHRRHMTQAQINAMHSLLNKYVTTSGKRVFGWGGDWKVATDTTPGFCDEMHLEAIQNWSPGSHGSNATVADFKNVQKRLGIKSDGTISTIQKIINVFKPAPKPPVPVPAPKPVPTPAPVAKPVTPVPAPKPAAVEISVAAVQPGKKNKQVGIVQQALKDLNRYSGPINNYFDKDTKLAYTRWQEYLGYKGKDADGVPGVKSLTALGEKSKFIVVP
jgi:hypothetical protein